MTVVKYRGEYIEVDYSVYGEHIPQTHWQPAEYPDYTVEDVFYHGTSIFAILNENDLDEISESLIATLEY